MPSQSAESILDSGQEKTTVGFFGRIPHIILYIRGRFCYVFLKAWLCKYPVTTMFLFISAGNQIKPKDAGVVSFAVGSMVDRSRSVGFQSSSGNLICVAPVVDVSMRPGSPANLFAYGMNCCKHRGSFNCDDAGNPAARYGMVLPEPSDILPPLLRDAFGPSAEDLEAAVRLQQASFGRAPRTQSRHTFVQYVADPLKFEMAHVDTAVITGVGCSVLYLAVLTLAVSSIVLGNGTVGSFFRRLIL